jgi:hypothetical protein
MGFSAEAFSALAGEPFFPLLLSGLDTTTGWGYSYTDPLFLSPFFCKGSAIALSSSLVGSFFSLLGEDFSPTMI